MKNLYKALSDFQQECPVIHKGTTGYGYSYASLPEVYEIVYPLLKKHGLGFTQMVNAEGLRTVLFHIESGETIESTTPLIGGVKLAKMNDFQVMGSQITYLRRYALSSMLGIVTDKDTDATGKQPERTMLLHGSDAHTKAIAALKAGTVKVAAIEKKYELSKLLKDEFTKFEKEAK